MMPVKGVFMHFGKQCQRGCDRLHGCASCTYDSCDTIRIGKGDTMGYYPIVSRNQKQMEGLDHQELPKAYMEDFSVLGFRVDDCKRALGILEKSSIDVKQSHGRALVRIEPAARITEVIQILYDNGLYCEVTDIAQGMYQG